ncbi:unnamed protein product [Symbiodinium sp. CCMP2456]|nr:unnamed protein product [Symbiodinium sp. CCMP2456]
MEDDNIVLEESVSPAEVEAQATMSAGGPERGLMPSSGGRDDTGGYGGRDRERSPEDQARELLENCDGLEPPYEYMSVEGTADAIEDRSPRDGENGATGSPGSFGEVLEPDRSAEQGLGGSPESRGIHRGRERAGTETGARRAEERNQGSGGLNVDIEDLVKQLLAQNQALSEELAYVRQESRGLRSVRAPMEGAGACAPASLDTMRGVKACSGTVGALNCQVPFSTGQGHIGGNTGSVSVAASFASREPSVEYTAQGILDAEGRVQVVSKGAEYFSIASEEVDAAQKHGEAYLVPPPMDTAEASRISAAYKKPESRTRVPDGPPPESPPSVDRAESQETSKDYLPGERTMWELPKLGTPSEPNPALRCSDWLHRIQPSIHDLAPKAHLWWTEVISEARRAYGLWVSASPLERIAIKGLPSERLKAEKYLRLESRALAMLSKAVPQTIYDYALSVRNTTCVGLVFFVLKAFQPGGLHERTELLKGLTVLPEGTSARQGVDALNMWFRHLERARGMSVAIPDCTLLLDALDTMSKSLLERSPALLFRMNTTRMALQLDTVPTLSSVEQFARALMAELEVIAVSGGDQQGNKGDAAKSGGEATAAIKEATQLLQSMRIASVDAHLRAVPVTPIVSVAALLELGFRVSWTKEHCRIWHHTRGQLDVDATSGCPEIDHDTALSLISEYEGYIKEKDVHEARVRCILQDMVSTTNEDLSELMRSGGVEALAAMRMLVTRLFPEVPDELQKQVPPSLCQSGILGGWNRRTRRRAEKADGIVVHFSEKDSRRVFEDTVDRCGWMLLHVDVHSSALSEAAYAFLISLAMKGPEASTRRHDDILVLRMMFLHAVASGVSERLRLLAPVFVLEQPEDQPGSDIPSLWVTPEWRAFASMFEVGEVSFDQGPLLHQKRRPTTLASNLPPAASLIGNDCKYCVRGSARRKQHRRVLCPEAWSLSVDTAGPYKKGDDEMAKGVRYMIVGVLTVPVIAFEKEEEPAAPEDPAEGVGGALDDEELLADGEDEPDEPLSAKEVAEARCGNNEWDKVLERDQKAWKEEAEKDHLPRIKLIEWPFVEPVAGKTQQNVLAAIRKMRAEALSLGFEVKGFTQTEDESTSIMG